MICYLGKYPENNHTINNEPIGKIEWQDLQGGMTVVNDLVERQGIPVFDLIDVALECATKVRINVCNNGILIPKLFWSTVRKNCSIDREKLLKYKVEGWEFSKCLRSLEKFIQTVKGQNNFC